MSGEYLSSYSETPSQTSFFQVMSGSTEHPNRIHFQQAKNQWRVGVPLLARLGLHVPLDISPGHIHPKISLHLRFGQIEQGLQNNSGWWIIVFDSRRRKKKQKPFAVHHLSFGFHWSSTLSPATNDSPLPLPTYSRVTHPPHRPIVRSLSGPESNGHW